MMQVETNGAQIPALGLGTWQLTGQACAQIVERAIADGYRHIDTAQMYDNETEVGAGIRASGIARDALFVTTKIWPDQLEENTFQKAVRQSLERLQMDYVDLLLIHWPPKGRDDVGEWMRLLNTAVDARLSRHIGVSNFTVAQVDAAAAASQHPLVCNQVENHPYIDQRRVRAACARNGMAMTAYSPLYRGGAVFEELAVVSAAQNHGNTPAQVVLRWHVQGGSIAIPKTATPERLAENIDIFDFALSAAEMTALDSLRSAHSRICDFEFAPEWDAPGAA